MGNVVEGIVFVVPLLFFLVLLVRLSRRGGDGDGGDGDQDGDGAP